MTQIITDASIYWDSQDRSNEGWAYKYTVEGGHQESGPLDEYLDDWATLRELRDAMIRMLHEHGIIAEDHHVMADAHSEGGFALWCAPKTTPISRES